MKTPQPLDIEQADPNISSINKEEFKPGLISLFSATATMLADMMIYPIDTISTRIKANTTEFVSFRKQYQLIVRQEGYRNLYKGFSTAMAGTFIPQFIYFYLYETLNKVSVNIVSHFTQQQYHSANLFIPLVTAPIAELFSVLVYIPFDVVRTRLQMNMKEYDYKGTIDGLIRVQRDEGIIRLFKASPLFVTQMAVQTTLQFWFYELCRTYFLQKNHTGEIQKQLSLKESLISSVIATGISSVLLNPLDLLIIRYQLVDSNKQRLSSKQIVLDLIRNEGYKAGMKGVSAKLTRECFYAIFFLPVYEYFKSKYGITLDA